MSAVPTHFGKKCGRTRKRKYRSSADAYMDALRYSNRMMRAYRCDACGAWHLTSS